MTEIFQSGELIYVSGLSPTVEGNVAAQTRNLLQQVQQELSKANSSLDRVVSVLVFLRAVGTP